MGGEHMVPPRKKFNTSPEISLESIQKDRLIKIISKSGNRYGDKLLDFMEQYKLSGLNKANTKQLEEYIKKNGLR